MALVVSHWSSPQVVYRALPFKYVLLWVNKIAGMNHNYGNGTIKNNNNDRANDMMTIPCLKRPRLKGKNPTESKRESLEM